MVLLRGDSLVCSNGLTVKHPTLAEIYDEIGMEEWSFFISLFTTTPYEQMVILDNVGQDYEKISNYDLFLMIFSTIRDFKTFNYMFNKINGKYFTFRDSVKKQTVIYLGKDGELINRQIYNEISNYIRKISGAVSEKQLKFGNNATKKRYLAQQKKKAKREAKRKNKNGNDWLENVVSALVWSAESKYNFTTIYDLKIYQIMNGIKRISKSRDVYYKSMGVYSGNLDPKKLSESDFNWIGKL